MPGGTGYVNWDTIYGLNQPQAGQMADTLASQNTPTNVPQPVAASTGLTASGQMPNTRNKDQQLKGINGLQDPYGLQATFQAQNAGKGAYTPGESLYDALLANQAGGAKFRDLKNQWQHLWGPKGTPRTAPSTVAPPPPPPTPTPPTPIPTYDPNTPDADQPMFDPVTHDFRGTWNGTQWTWDTRPKKTAAPPGGGI